MQNFEKLAALGALGVAGGAMAAWLGFVWLVRPVPTGGMDGTSLVVAASAALTVFGSVAAAHAWFGMQLKRGAESISG